MYSSGFQTYYVYILTNKNKTVLYVGLTNDLHRRLIEHEQSSTTANSKSFTGKYNVHFLIYYETFGHISDAIAREKEIKDWRREKKEALINKLNPDWKFLNTEV